MRTKGLRLCVGILLSLLLLVTSIPVNGLGGVINVKAEEGSDYSISPSDKIYVYYKQIENSQDYIYRFVGDTTKGTMTNDWTAGNDKGTPSWTGSANESDGMIPLYEVYNSEILEYYYTTNKEWVDTVADGEGWICNGIVTYVYSESAESKQYMYSVYNPNSGIHSYTPYITTRDKYIKAGWMYDGTPFKVNSVETEDPDTLPIGEAETIAPSDKIYLYYHRKDVAGDCTYKLVGENGVGKINDGSSAGWITCNDEETPTLIGSATEGDNLKPLYELYQPWTCDCVYTIDEDEVKSKTESGSWLYLGITTYVYSSDASEGVDVYSMTNSKGNAHCYTPYDSSKEALTEKGWGVENDGKAVWKALKVQENDPNVIPGALTGNINPSSNIYTYYRKTDNNSYVFRLVGDDTREQMEGWTPCNSENKESWTGSQTEETEMTPLFEVYNPQSDDYHYTIFAQEATWLTTAGWNYSGIVTYLYPAESNEGYDVWRLYNSDSYAHFNTPYEDVKNELIKAGWLEDNDGQVVWKAVSIRSENPDILPEFTPTSEPEPTPSPSPSTRPTPTPTPTPEPTPEPTPDAPDTSDDSDSVNPDDSDDTAPKPEPEELIPDEVIDSIIEDFGETFVDESGTQMTVEDNGKVTISDNVLGEASVSPTVFVEGKVYTLYNPNTGEHFYTKNPEERNALREHGWSYEANRSEVAIRADDKGAKPVYRMYNPNAGMHHFTTNQSEARMLQQIGWGYEGISFYAFEPHDNQGTSVYRVYCPFPDSNGNNQHVFTSDKSERDYLMTLGYEDEGICWRTR